MLAARGAHVQQNTDEHIPLPECNDEFADLKENLRAKVQIIAGRETLENAWHVFNYMAAQVSSPTNCGSAAPGPVAAVSSASPLDERLKKLKNYIVREEEKEKQLRAAASLAQLSKRVFLAELFYADADSILIE